MTVPAKSRPGIRGYWVRGNAPLALRRSLGWIAEAWTFITRCFGRRAGLGTVVWVSVGGVVGSGRVRRRAFMVAIIDVVYIDVSFE